MADWFRAGAAGFATGIAGGACAAGALVYGLLLLAYGIGEGATFTFGIVAAAAAAAAAGATLAMVALGRTSLADLWPGGAGLVCALGFRAIGVVDADSGASGAHMWQALGLVVIGSAAAVVFGIRIFRALRAIPEPGRWWFAGAATSAVAVPVVVWAATGFGS